MYKKFSLALVIASILVTGFSCKKKSSSTTTDDSPANTTVTPDVTNTFSVNGTSEGTNLTLIKGATSNNNSYEYLMVGTPWVIGIFFSGTNTPVSGTYAVEDSTDIVPATKCYISAAGPDNNGGLGHSGSVVVNAGTPTTITFNNVIANKVALTGTVVTSYSLSGTIRY